MGCSACKLILLLNSMVLSLVMVSASQLLWVSCNLRDELQPIFSTAASRPSSYLQAGDHRRTAVSAPTAAQSHCQETQRAALLEFYQAGIYNFGSDASFTWYYRTTHDLDCCNWDGVSCDASGLVVSLSIHNDYNSKQIHLNASGVLNASVSPWPLPLAKLHALQNLELGHFYFALPIPSEIRLLSQTLSNLSITDSDLRPPFPWAALSNLSSLTHLTLKFSTSLEGSHLSRELCNLTRLQYLDLSFNGFGGSIPSCLSSVSGLSYLDLSFNHLIGLIPQHWNASSSLLHLDLQRNELAGPIYTGLLAQDMQYLALNDNNLTGNIPKTIGNLTKLAHLFMAHNHFLGALPDQWGKLSNLADLDLSFNQLDGRIPVSLGHIGLNYGFTSMDLSSNFLAGDLPWSLFTSDHIVSINLQYNDLTGVMDIGLSALNLMNISLSLQLLNISHNRMAGPIPSWIAGMQGLIVLDLSFNKLGSPLDKSFANFSAAFIETLDLSSNQLTGPIPSWISHFTDLRRLNLSSNHLQGTIPAWLWSLPRLQYIDLSTNLLNGDVSLDGLCSLTSDEDGAQFVAFNNNLNRFFSDKSPMNDRYCASISMTLDLHSNNLSGVVPWDSFMGKYNVLNLELAENSLFGEFPEVIDWNALHNVDLSHNLLSGRIPDSLSKNSLTSLQLSFNHYSGKIPTSICQPLGSIVSLKLAHNSLSGLIPGELGHCKNLVSLVLENNELIGPIPSGISNLSESLVVLDLSHNHLTGGIPSWVQQMHSLRVLSFGFNGLSGPLPSTTWNNTQLQVLDLSNNNLSGTISAQSLTLLQGFHYSSIQSRSTSNSILYDDSVTIEGKGQELHFVYLLTATVSLDLSNNILTGHIPPELASLDGLIFLNLSKNQLTGQIPESLGSLRQLNSLDVSQNALEGEIPQKAFCPLTFLSIVDLSYNNLRGLIPQCNQWVTFSKKSFLGNQGLCGPPLDLPCPSITTSVLVGGGPIGKGHTGDYDFLLGIIVSFCISFPLVFATSLFWLPLSHRISKASKWILGRLGRGSSSMYM